VFSSITSSLRFHRKAGQVRLCRTIGFLIPEFDSASLSCEWTDALLVKLARSRPESVNP